MANFVYAKAKQGILNGQFNFSTDNFKVAFVKSSYTPNQSTHEFLSDIGSSNISYASNNITGITNTNGTIDANNLTITIPANSPFNSIVFYKVGSNDNDSRLLFYIDTSEGLPFTGSAENSVVAINWNDDVNKILSI